LSFASSPDKCSSVRVGKFYYISKLLGQRIMIDRTDSTQIETTPDGAMVKSKIIWTSNCSYDMYVNSLSENKTFDDSVMSSIPLNVKIASIKKDYYVYKATMKRTGMSLELSDTVYYVK
jgi:hypothetical protein